MNLGSVRIGSLQVDLTLTLPKEEKNLDLSNLFYFEKYYNTQSWEFMGRGLNGHKLHPKMALVCVKKAYIQPLWPPSLINMLPSIFSAQSSTSIYAYEWFASIQ